LLTPPVHYIHKIFVMATEDPVISLAVEISIGGYIVHRLEGLGVKVKSRILYSDFDLCQSMFRVPGSRYYLGWAMVGTNPDA